MWSSKKYHRGKIYLTIIQVNADYHDRALFYNSTDTVSTQKPPSCPFLSTNPLSSKGIYYPDLDSNHLPAT